MMARSDAFLLFAGVALALALIVRVVDFERWPTARGAFTPRPPTLSTLQVIDEAGAFPEDDRAETDATDPPRRDAPALHATPDDAERRILERLAMRRKRLDEREARIETREAVIAAAEASLERRAEALAQTEARLEALRRERESADTQELRALIGAYENMRPRDAAAILNELDEPILIAVASGLRTQSLAGVLAQMRPEKARIVTKILAERAQLTEAPPGPAP